MEESLVKSLINKTLRVQISDGRVLVGALLCTDREQNLIMGGASEFWCEQSGEPRMLGLVMVPGRHITSVHIDSSYADVVSLISEFDKSK